MRKLLLSNENYAEYDYHMVDERLSNRREINVLIDFLITVTKY